MDTLARTTDFALVVHVWHLDVLDDLAAAADNLPPGVDRFVTVPDSFSAAQRARVATALPGAVLVAVENAGQDVGALFQLMGKVDLGRYDFICKIHTKKGMNMPEIWRTALFGGVLGSAAQAGHIVARFRADPQLMLAGARQLFLHGPSYLFKNAEGLVGAFAPMIGTADIREMDWGFIAGTCFWIRTSVLTRMAACEPRFRAGDYTTDGTLAHAAERMFGLAVALSGGKVLLQDLRFPDRFPEPETGFPADLPRVEQSIPRILTPLAANLFVRPRRAPVTAVLQPRRRVAVFASYSGNGLLPPQVIPYLQGLKPLVSDIVVVCDNDLLPEEIQKLSGLAAHVITGRHGEYDFGSYKRGVAWLRETGRLDSADALVLCNDSCFGPVGSFEPMFATMEAKGLDFWGATDSHQINYHLQSYFVVLTRKAFSSQVFRDFISGIEKEANVQQVILNYELGLTRCLKDAGFTSGAMLENQLEGVHPKDPTYWNMTMFPLYAMESGVPLVKVKALREPRMNMNSQGQVLNWLYKHAPDVHACATSDLDIAKFEDAKDIAFSIIMPTHNRAWCISVAVEAVLAQTHENFELIIVDDGSSDGTEAMMRDRFAQDFVDGKIRYVRLEKNIGVCNARNVGLAHARNPLIAYADSDNAMRPYYLTMMASLIVAAPEKDAFYGRFIHVNSGRIVGKPFDGEGILHGNFIDLGVFVHRLGLVARLGGFDGELRRLVDWDLCIRYTRHKAPGYLSAILLDYTDQEHSDRISVKESFLKAKIAVHSKHGPKPTVSTAIVGYNHEDFLVEAIESALEQKGDFYHEILLSDDGSSDATARIMARYAAKYPGVIRNITRGGNHGISANYRHCFREASGNYVAILEGDDYWTDPEKNLRQAEFLKRHDTAPMVFSRIELFDMRNNSRRLLKRQEGLPELVSAREFAADQNLNLIVNLSCCMFRKDVMTALPSVLYDPRLSEIALAFYLDRLGPLGFLPGVMSTYRLNGASVWTGADQASQLRQAIAVRQMALKVARPIYHATLRRHIAEKEAALAALTKTGQSPRAA
ncbi:rhamnan synthesis F family protein [Paenirhodobacter enshiensis]|uniref:Glycosyltransferase 2-like domain-containing protein n=1 Tax=Paenirhodobacter enshiensis TaxID=1105367 RepID=A0A086XSY5_9RHOB|nr:rhamnan synthesis F family protein [Paenirhodobacter enshiensis]KFI25135.1 hypothetical protein CG50_06120 [Paenirhodobacter enshiensis]